MTIRIGRGSTYTFTAYFREAGTGTLVDSPPVTVDILDPADITIVSAAPATAHPATGTYTYDHTVGVSADLGIWTIVWHGVIDSQPASNSENFEVLGVGQITFPPTAIILPADLALYMDSVIDEDAAAIVIAGVQSALETYLGRTVLPVDRIEDVPLDHVSNLFFPNTPLITINSIKADGAVQDLSQEIIRPWGIQGYGGQTNTTNNMATLDYRSGLDGQNLPDIVQLVLRASAREMVRRADQALGVYAITDESYSTTYLEPDQVFTVNELRRMDKYRRRRLPIESGITPSV